MKRILLLITIALLGISSTKASHMVAGELSYECLGGNQYEISLTVYRDCSGISFGTSATVNISSSCSGSQSVTLQGVDLSPNDASTNAIQDTGYLCDDYLANGQTTCTGGQFPGVHIYLYTATVTLAPCADWLISYSSCCRPSTYNYPAPNNCSFPIQGAGTVGTMRHTGSSQYLEATLNNADGACNSSPIFYYTPRAFICQGQEVYFDNGAFDPDGDSLTFELTDPLENATTGINYNSGYSFDHPFDLEGGGNLNINTTTGLTIMTPFDRGKVCGNQDSLEQSSTAVKIRQFRNGVEVGSILRDVQIVTLPGCDPLDPVNLGIQTVSNTAGFINDSTARVCAGDTFSFSIRITDFVNLDSFDLESNFEQLVPNSEFEISYADSAGNDIIGSFFVEPTNEDEGTYFFTVTAENAGCPVQITRVFSFTLEIVGRTLAYVDLDSSCVNQQDTLNLWAEGGDNFTWSRLDGNDTLWIDNPDTSHTAAWPTQTVEYLVTSDLDVPNCPNTDTLLVTKVQPPYPLPEIGICFEDTATLAVVWNGYTPSEHVVYMWNDDDDLDDSLFITTEEGEYFYFAQDTVDYSDTIVCDWVDTAMVTIIDCPVDIPNIFTPNGDGFNDVFFIDNIQNEIWNLTIYNRWGKKVLVEFLDYQNDWDGGELKDGTYYYTLTNQDGAEFTELKGWCVIAR